MQSGYEINKYKATVRKTGRNEGITVSLVSNPEYGVMTFDIPVNNTSYGRGGGLVSLGEMADMKEVVKTCVENKPKHFWLQKGEQHEHSGLNFEAINNIDHALKAIKKEVEEMDNFCTSGFREAMKEGNTKELAKEKRIMHSAFKIIEQNASKIKSKLAKL